MFRSGQVRAALLAAVWVSAGSVSAATAADAPPVVRDTIRPDPAVRRGVLPNGLRYAVRRNATPSGGVTLRLAVDAGSLQEEDDEQGLAHFVEHMAFNGTRSFPEGSLDTAFGAQGVAFGRDHNATTDETQTLYRVDLKGAGPGELDLGFRWLRDVADGMLFTPDAVARERGVVLAEREARNSPEAEARLTLARFRGEGLRATARPPIGTPESIAGATPQRLRDFYTRWYRPDNVAVAAVGDAPVEELERRIVQAFGDWTASGPAPARPALGAPAARALEVAVLADPRLTPTVSICRVRRPDPVLADNLPRMRRTIVSILWRHILQRRLDDLTRRAASPVLGVAVQTDTTSEAQQTCFDATPVKGRWEAALTAVEAEVRSFATTPPSEAEVSDVIQDLRAGARGAIAAGPTRPTADIADELVQALLDGDVVATPEEEMRALNAAVEEATSAEVKAAFDAEWSGAGPLISVLSPEPPTADVVKAAWVRGDVEPAESPRPEIAAATWGYAIAPNPGRIAKREVAKDPGFTRVRFANGVVLNFRQTSFAKGEIRLRATFGAGRAEIADRDQAAAILGASLTPLGGLGRNSYDEIDRLMGHGGWGVDLHVEDDAFVIDGSTMSAGLYGELAILAAYFTDPGFRPTLEPQAAGLVDGLYRHVANDPAATLNEALDRTMYPGRASGLPPRETLAALKAQDYARLLKPALTQAPIVLTLVGDVDEATAIEAVGRTFGVMAPRPTTARVRAGGEPGGDPVVSTSLVRATHHGPSDKAAAAVVWPLYADGPGRRRETYAVTLAAWVLEDQLRLRVRERLGKAYAPQADAEWPDDGRQGALRAVVETGPADVMLVLDEMRRTAADLAAGGLTAEMIETVRRPVLRDMDGERLTNDWWLDELSQSARDEVRAARERDARSELASITLDDVRKAAAEWLSRPAAAGVSMPVARQLATAQGGAN